MEHLAAIPDPLQPLLMSIGRAILGAAALEKVLLVDIAQRRVVRDGFVEQLSHDLAQLERRPAGNLLRAMRELVIADDLAERIQDVIDRRNQLVHRFTEDPEVFAAIATGQMEPVVERVDQIAEDCAALIEAIASPAFSQLERLFGANAAELLGALRHVDPAAVDDARLREQLELLRVVKPEQLGELLQGDDGSA